MAIEMHSPSVQTEMRACAFCTTLFQPRVPWQSFCRSKCRNDYNQVNGVTGRIVVNRKLLKGRTSIVLRFDGPNAEAALKLSIGDVIQISKART